MWMAAKKKEENSNKELDPRIFQIARKIKRLRIEAGYKGAESFSYDNDLPRSYYWETEKGNNFTISRLLRILDIHEISLEDFFRNIDKE